MLIGMDSFSLVVIHNFYVVRSMRVPSETDAKLIIDSHAILPFPIRRKGLQVVARRNPQIFKLLHQIELSQFADSDSRKSRKFAAPACFEQSLRLFVRERPNQVPMV
jgi:hypothetical protein